MLVQKHNIVSFKVDSNEKLFLYKNLYSGLLCATNVHKSKSVIFYCSEIFKFASNY